MTEQALTITRLEVENVKRVKLARIYPDGSLVVIGGANDQGKSSLTDAIRMLLGGEREVPETALRRGAKRGHVIGQLGDELLVERKFTAGGKSSLVVSDLEGNPKKSPQALLAKLYSSLTFDPLDFTRQKPEEQATMLQRALGIDLAPIRDRKAQAFTDRTAVNRRIRDLEGQLRAAPHHAGVPGTEQSVTDLVERSQAQQRARLERQAAGERVREELKRAERVQEQTADEVRRLREQLARAEQMLLDAAEATEAAQTAVDALPPVEDEPSSDITAELAELEATNAKVRQNLARAAIEKKLDAERAEVDRLEAVMASCDEEQAAALARAKLPVEGLSFSEEGRVLLNELPLDQAATSQRIRLSVAIGFALNPRLKVLLIREGSELDSKALQLVAEIAHEHGGQVWIEKVSEDGVGCSVVLEDGEARTVAAAE